MFVKLLGGIVGVIGVFWLAIAGGYAVWWWDREPVRPTWTQAHFLLWHLPGFVTDPSLGAQLAAIKDEEAAAAARAVALEKSQAQLSASIAAKDQAAQVQIRTVTRTLIQEVPTYVSSEAVARFPVPVGFVRLFNAAAGGVDVSAIPGPAGVADDQASGVGLDTVARVSVSDLGQCRAQAQELSDLQDWVSAMRAASK